MIFRVHFRLTKFLRQLSASCKMDALPGEILAKVIYPLDGIDLSSFIMVGSKLSLEKLEFTKVDIDSHPRSCFKSIVGCTLNIEQFDCKNKQTKYFCRRYGLYMYKLFLETYYYIPSTLVDIRINTHVDEIPHNYFSQCPKLFSLYLNTSSIQNNLRFPKTLKVISADILEMKEISSIFASNLDLTHIDFDLRVAPERTFDYSCFPNLISLRLAAPTNLDTLPKTITKLDFGFNEVEINYNQFPNLVDITAYTVHSSEILKSIKCRVVDFLPESLEKFDNMSVIFDKLRKTMHFREHYRTHHMEILQNLCKYVKVLRIDKCCSRLKMLLQSHFTNCEIVYYTTYRESLQLPPMQSLKYGFGNLDLTENNNSHAIFL